MASRRQILFQVIQEKIPLGRAPIPVAFGAPIKAGREGGDIIKPCPQIGQLFERFDCPDNVRHAEKIDKISKERELVDVETENFVSQLREKIKEESPAASEVQNALARATMKPPGPGCVCGFRAKIGQPRRTSRNDLSKWRNAFESRAAGLDRDLPAAAPVAAARVNGAFFASLVDTTKDGGLFRSFA